MSDCLTTLPVELLQKILDNVPSLDIFSSLCLVNKRLRSVSLAYPRFQPNFSCAATLMSKNQFDCICTRLLYSISQVISLTLFDKNDPMTPAKNALFFSRFSNLNSTFSNLRSLTLTYINYDAWCLFKTRLPLHVVTLSIHLVHVGKRASLSMTSTILSELLFYSPLLRRLSLKMSNYTDRMIKIHAGRSAAISPLHYFHLEGVTIDLSRLFVTVPMLNTLEINFHDPDLSFNQIHPPPLYLQRLRIEVHAITWLDMVILLSPLSRLAYLTVIADDLDNDMADGFAWARLLRKVKNFQFKFQFHWNAFRQQPINLNSFRTKFWLEEKKWFVTYDRRLKNDCSILYSIPSSTDDCLSDEIIGLLVSESTGSEPTLFPHVHCLTIKYQYLKYALLHRYTDVRELNLSQIATTFPMTFKDLATYLDTSRIVKCYVRSEWIKKSPNELIGFLRNLPCLHALSVSITVLNYLFLYQWPDIVHLRIENDFGDSFQVLSSYEIDALCCSFPRIQRLDIHSSFINDLAQLLNRMKRTLTDIIIRQPRIIDNKQFITREWIERNTELQHFHYSCDAENSVSLWF